MNTFHEKAALRRAAENTCYFAMANCAGAGSSTTSAVVRPDRALLSYQSYGNEGLLIADIGLDAATGLLAGRCKRMQIFYGATPGILFAPVPHWAGHSNFQPNSSETEPVNLSIESVLWVAIQHTQVSRREQDSTRFVPACRRECSGARYAWQMKEFWRIDGFTVEGTI
jgi:hypothetical protein